MDTNSMKYLIGIKAANSDMGFGTNAMVSGLSFGLTGKILHLYSDRTWKVVSKSGNALAAGKASDILGVKKVSDGFELTFSSAQKKRWLRVTDKSSVLPWMGSQRVLDAMEGLLEYWRIGDHSFAVQGQPPVSSPVKYLGGAGSNLIPETLGTLWMTATGFAMRSGESFWHQSISNLVGVQIGGQGIYTTGGGWVGGGVGFNGAMKGAAMASMMNALETRVHNDCLMRLSFENAELNFQVLDITPRDLELQLAPLRLHLEKYLGVTSTSTMKLSGTVGITSKKSEKDLTTRLQELKQAFDEGLLSQLEYESKRSAFLENL